jgi:hypothetical protein
MKLTYKPRKGKLVAQASSLCAGAGQRPTPAKTVPDSLGIASIFLLKADC